MIGSDITDAYRYGDCHSENVFDCNHKWNVWAGTSNGWKTDTNVTILKCFQFSPTETPSSVPSSEPSHTESPTMIPSKGPETSTSIVIGTTNTSNVDGHGATANVSADTANTFVGISKTIDEIAIYTSLGALFVLVVVFLLYCFHNKISIWSGSDKPNYLSVLRYVQAVIDFWTDILFAFTMYLRNKITYFYLSIVFIIIPLLFSIVSMVYWTYRWRTKTSIIPLRIHDYLKKHSMILVLFTIIGSFGSAISLVQSKFCLRQMFNFPLTNVENDHLRVWKFINSTLLEVKKIKN